MYIQDNNDTITITGSQTHVNNIHTGAGDDKITIEKVVRIRQVSMASRLLMAI